MCNGLPLKCRAFLSAKHSYLMQSSVYMYDVCPGAACGNVACRAVFSTVLFDAVKASKQMQPVRN